MGHVKAQLDCWELGVGSSTFDNNKMHENKISKFYNWHELIILKLWVPKELWTSFKKIIALHKYFITYLFFISLIVLDKLRLLANLYNISFHR